MKQQSGLPTKNIYDLLIDKKGFLWVASDLGVSRYDGINYVNFTHPSQTSIGSTGLLEDRYGRIWFNNFAGQIFYIEDDQIQLLKSYDAGSESKFQHMALFNNKLISTSDKGLFVLELATLKAKYIRSVNGSDSYTNSLAIIGNKVIARGNGKWFVYKPDGSFKQTPFVGLSRSSFGESAALQNVYHNGATYLISNPSGSIEKVSIRNDTIYSKPYKQFGGFINSLTTDKGKLWINTTKASYSVTNGDHIDGYNITDVVTDDEGNQWFGSLNQGLLVNYKYDGNEKIRLSLLDTNDLVASTTKYGKKLLLGTQGGALILYNPTLKRSEWKIVFPENGSINNITPISETDFIIGTAINTYRINIQTRKFSKVDNIMSVKQVSNVADMICIASTSGVFIIPKSDSDSLRNVIGKRFGNAFGFNKAKQMFVLNKPALAICYSPESQTLMIAFKKGLYEINQKGLIPFIYDKSHVYATSLDYSGNHVLIGTNNALLVIKNKIVKKITVHDGLFSSAIFKIKPESDHVWILGSGLLQLFNIKTLTPVANYGMPLTTKVQVSDISEIDTTVYVTTSNGLIGFPLKRTNAQKIPQDYIVSVKVNNEYYPSKGGLTLNYRQNNILFKISIASYTDAHDIYFKYRLETGANSAWQMTEPGERVINFSSLMPGKYLFTAFAIDPRLGESRNMIRYEFTIKAPWWHQVWFKILVSILILLGVSYIYMTETLKKMALRRAYAEQQQSINTERQRISSEIHDDIGAGIFAINLYADLANKKNGAVEEITSIKSMIDDLSDKIREIIWTTNVENDTLENLLYFIQFQVSKLFEHTNIALIAELPDEFPDFNITSHARRNIYLMVKEIAHNAIKHSEATTFIMKVTLLKTNLSFNFKDNGIGIDTTQVKTNSMGLKNLRLRIERLQGQLAIGGEKGTTVIVFIPISEIIVETISEKEKKGMSFFRRR